jgi:nitrogen fixation protein NifQ
MQRRQLYLALMGDARPESCSGFDIHVIASVLALVLSEGDDPGAALVLGTGLLRDELFELSRALTPHVLPLFERALQVDVPLVVAPDEACLRELLVRYSAERTRFEELLAFIVARRCQRPHHLWQDLGLRNRRELSWLMERHFPALAARNARDMKWKKFLYRTICRDESFGLCTAPSCGECEDYRSCFGEEDGVSLMG